MYIQWPQNRSYQFTFRGDGPRIRPGGREYCRRRRHGGPGTAEDSRWMLSSAAAPRNLVRGPAPSRRNRGEVEGERNRGPAASWRRKKGPTSALRTTQRVRHARKVKLKCISLISIAVFTGGKPLPSDDVLNALFSRLMVRGTYNIL